MMFAVLVCLAGVLPVLANSPIIKIGVFIGMILGKANDPTNQLGSWATVGAILGLTPAWPIGAAIL